MPIFKSLICRFLGVLIVILAAVGVAFGQTTEGSEAREARLTEIAVMLGESPSDPSALVTDAVRLCGFAIWSEDAKPVSEPSGTPRLKLAVTAAEIRAMCEMWGRGNRVALGDFAAGLEVTFKEELTAGEVLSEVQAFLRTGSLDANPSKRALCHFLSQLAVLHSDPADAGFAAASKLDPIQAVLLARIVMADLSTQMRRNLDAIRPNLVLASIAPMSAQVVPMPGYIEDGYSGTITSLFESVVKRLKPDKALENYTGQLGKINAAAAITKFLLTYNFMKCAFTVEAPGQP